MCCEGCEEAEWLAKAKKAEESGYLGEEEETRKAFLDFIESDLYRHMEPVSAEVMQSISALVSGVTCTDEENFE